MQKIEGHLTDFSILSNRPRKCKVSDDITNATKLSIEGALRKFTPNIFTEIQENYLKVENLFDFNPP